MTDKTKPTPSGASLKPLLWVSLGIVGTVLTMFAINGVPQGLKEALETQAQKEQRLAEVQRQAVEALLQSGQWRDPATGLIWTRCSLGQTWNGSGCNGEAKEFNWWDAHQAALDHSEGGHSDWRLPTASELASLMAGKVHQGKEAYLLEHKNDGEKRWNDLSAAEQNDHQQNYFYSGQKGYVSPKLEKPESNSFGGFSSSSPYVGYSSGAWYVNFSYGHVLHYLRDSYYAVRLVRASQSLEGGNAALLAFEQQAKNIYQDPAYLKWQEEKRQVEARKQEDAQREAEARRERFLVGDTAYVCSGTLFGESTMCKTEVLDVSGDRIKVVHQTRCTSIAYKGYVEWVPKNSAGTVEQVRSGLRCN